MQSPELKKQAEAQAIYMQYLLQLATKKISDDEEPAFDPQGRVLTDVSLTAADYPKLAKLMKNTAINNQDTLNAALGIKATSTTTVSVDINKIDAIQAKFYSKITDTEPLTALNKADKGSIIALQQEFHSHLALSSRIYQTVISDKYIHKGATQEKADLQAKITTAHLAAMKRVNNLVMTAYAKALKDSLQKNDKLNIAKLNVALDKARKSIAPQAHSILMQEIIKNTGVVLTKNDLKDAKKLAEKTTATPNDVLHTDSGLGIATLVMGSDCTAHNRERGEKVADRQLITHFIGNDNVSITPHENPRIQIRTPSIALKDNTPEKAIIDDVALKLEALRKKHNLPNFVYNLLTAFNVSGIDESKNLQTQSARHILLGAHKYNMNQINNSNTKDNPALCFVQNISVNGFGDTLAYDTGDPLREELTLMADMALLHTLASPKDYEKFVLGPYKEYLASLESEIQSQPPYFSQTPDSKIIIQSIKNLTMGLKSENSQGDSSILAQAKNTLRGLISHNLHFTHENSKLIQSLSVFVETASICGCKSGNERAQTINGRVAILDYISHAADGELSENCKIVKQELCELGTKNLTKELAQQHAERLRTTLDRAYNAYNLHGFASLVSNIDQGASAKVEAKPWYFKFLLRFFLSTNFGEESDQVMTNLSQSKAGELQAHKGLPELMKNAWEGYPKSWWDRMKSSPLKGLGAVLGTIIFPISLVVAAMGYRENTQTKAETEKSNIDLKETYNKTKVIDIKYSDQIMKESFEASCQEKHKKMPDENQNAGVNQVTAKKLDQESQEDQKNLDEKDGQRLSF
ncbi:MAG: hypothetical protein A3F46_01375 [Legionellales bacterium RIFCSPHIGHO2_12_FULL_42_9]|nr:MAG: hypothetical protein A3F46_01375 [Legionellales bacterium RIFCSPHIGHO2_12_FULL_42_9]